MRVAATRLAVMAVLVSLLAVGLTTAQTNPVICPAQPESETASESCSDSYHLRGRLSPISIESGEADVNGLSIENPFLPSAGALIYTDYVELEETAYALLNKALTMRQQISPYRSDNDFETHLRGLDVLSGYEALTYEGKKPGYQEATTFAELVNLIETDLRKARDIYAILVVFAPEARFRADPAYANGRCSRPEDPNPPSDPEKPEVVEPIINWCNFEARLRQSTREMVNVRMIVGQEFMVDALGGYFSGDFAGLEDPVRDEIAQLRAARYQFEKGEAFLAEGLKITIGNGCLISDFYTQTEWSLLTRLSSLQSTVQFHIATRESYLNVDGQQQVAQSQTKAQTTFRQSANDAHVKLIGMAGLANSVETHCEIGERPDGDLIAEMALSQLETKRRSREMANGLNIFGFDVTMTPAWSYASDQQTTCDGEALAKRGLWDQAKCLVEVAQILQTRAEKKGGAYVTSQRELNTALNEIRTGLDRDIYNATGCSSNAGDEAFFTCVEEQIDAVEACLLLVASPAPEPPENGVAPPPSPFDICMDTVGVGVGIDLAGSLRALRSDYLAFQEIEKSARNIDEQIQNSNYASSIVTTWLALSGSFETAARVSSSMLASTSCGSENPILGFQKDALCTAVGVVNTGLQATAGAMSTAADVEIAKAENSKEVKNLLLQLSQLVIDAESARQTYIATYNRVRGEIDVLLLNYDETKRQRAYFASDLVNDPSYRIVRDSARIDAAEALENAARIAYLAARRAEYEYGISLHSVNFAISDIYRARIAQDVEDYLEDLRVTVNLLPQRDLGKLTPIDLKVSVAQDILLLTDDVLINEGFVTPEAIEAERTRRFRLWVAEHTIVGEDDKQELEFNFTTSLQDGGLFSNVISEGYDFFWLLKLSGDGVPFEGSNGVSINLVSEEENLSYRRVVLTQGGMAHLRTDEGCIFDYRLMAPAKMVGNYWPENKSPSHVTAIFNADVNDVNPDTDNAFSTGSFYGQAISATDWKIKVFSGTPQVSLGLPDMDLQKLTDIELNLSAVYATRTVDQNGKLPVATPAQCVRTDY